jgi:hypothetical protein
LLFEPLGRRVPAPTVPANTIKCEFTNTTRDTVQFRLNGSMGVKTSLAAGKTG